MKRSKTESVADESIDATTSAIGALAIQASSSTTSSMYTCILYVLSPGFFKRYGAISKYGKYCLTMVIVTYT